MTVGTDEPIYEDVCQEQSYEPHMSKPPLTTDEIMDLYDFYEDKEEN